MIHDHWIREHGLDASYEAVPVPPDEASDFLRGFAGRGFVGGNVTMPHKDEAYRACEPDEAARRMATGGDGSVNTLWLEDGTVRGESTDGYGFLANLDERAVGWDRNASESVAHVLGAGGAALPLVDALRERGFRVRVSNRTRSKAERLVAGYERAEVVGWDAPPDDDVRLLVNATSLGMAGADVSPSWPPDVSGLPPDAVVCDIVYAPLRTALLEAAAARGLKTVDGLGMLLHQAVPGFERWFGVRPHVSAPLRRRVVQDLGEREPVFLGLTGSIGMGKSTTAAMFREAGVPVHDADAAVHALYRGAAAPLIEAAFPGTTGADGVDRDRLRAAVVGRPDAMRRLEGIVHPMVRALDDAFRERVAREGAPLAVLDIPLLFETDGAYRMDAVLVVSAPADVQRARVLRRGGMTEAQFEAILAQQVPDEEKRRRADFVIDTSQGLAHARSRVRDLVGQMSDPHWMPRPPAGPAVHSADGSAP